MKSISNKILRSLPITAVYEPIAESAPSGPLSEINNATDLVEKILNIGDVAIYILVSLAVIFIVYNIVWYFIKPDASESRREAGLNIFWGILGLFIIVSLWGLVNILVNTFNTNPDVPKDRFPTVDFINNRGESSSTNYGGTNYGF